jgi:hypothetical protein
MARASNGSSVDRAHGSSERRDPTEDVHATCGSHIVIDEGKSQSFRHGARMMPIDG